MAKTKLPVPGGLVIHEESHIVCREGMVITNQTAAEFQALVGHPVDASGNIVLATAEATAVGLLLENVLLPASGDSGAIKCAVLMRGPCAVNEGALAASDSAGADYTIATIVSTLEALGFTFRQEPTVSDTQVN